MRLLFLLPVLLAFGCGPKPGEHTTVPTGRFQVSYQGAFVTGDADSSLAKRNIYIITDTETGVQYLAVQGCGTSELHKSGKTMVEQ